VDAARVFRPDGDPRAGVVPGLRVPDHIDVPFLLPWIGTILAGSMGIVWFSYWTARRGYGGGVGASQQEDRYDGPAFSAEQRDDQLVSWFHTLSHTATVGVLTGTVTSFLVLGAELLGPRGIVPSGTDVAAQLTRLLSEVWGTVGHFIMVAAIVVAIGGSVLANQDGCSRSFADIASCYPATAMPGTTATDGPRRPATRRPHSFPGGCSCFSGGDLTRWRRGVRRRACSPSPGCSTRRSGWSTSRTCSGRCHSSPTRVSVVVAEGAGPR
jgi:hypothetical protein